MLLLLAHSPHLFLLVRSARSSLILHTLHAPSPHHSFCSILTCSAHITRSARSSLVLLTSSCSFSSMTLALHALYFYSPFTRSSRFSLVLVVPSHRSPLLLLTRSGWLDDLSGWRVCVRGRGRHGYEVRCAGGGIGAGFPSVTFGSMVSLDPYLVHIQRY